MILSLEKLRFDFKVYRKKDYREKEADGLGKLKATGCHLSLYARG